MRAVQAPAPRGVRAGALGRGCGVRAGGMAKVMAETVTSV